MNCLVDTTILIDHLRDRKKATAFLLEASNRLFVSSVSVAELIEGVKNKRELRDVKRLCDSFRVIQISKIASEKAIDYMTEFFLSHNLQFLDALIAAAATE